MREVAEMPKQGTGADFWMTIVEVPEGGWAVGGRPVSIGRLAPVFTEDRQAQGSSLGSFSMRSWWHG